MKLFIEFQDFSHVAFTDNPPLFKSCGMMFLPPQPSWLLDDLLMDKRDSDANITTIFELILASKVIWLFVVHLCC